jgi:hypothetical protein
MDEDIPETWNNLTPDQLGALAGKTAEALGRHDTREIWVRKEALQAALWAERDLPPALAVATDDLHSGHDHADGEACTVSATAADLMNQKARLIERATFGRILRHAQVFENYMNTGYTDEDWDRAGMYAELRYIDKMMEGDETDDDDEPMAGESEAT